MLFLQQRVRDVRKLFLSMLNCVSFFGMKLITSLNHKNLFPRLSISRIFSLELSMWLTTMFLLTTSFLRVNTSFTVLSSVNPPSPLVCFLEKCKRTHQIERFIVRRNKKLFLHNKKWEPLLPFLEQ